MTDLQQPRTTEPQKLLRCSNDSVCASLRVRVRLTTRKRVAMSVHAMRLYVIALARLATTIRCWQVKVLKMAAAVRHILR